MPQGFQYPNVADVWHRLTWDLAQHSRGAHFMESLFRLKPGVTSEAANGELRALTRRLGKENPSTNGEWNARAVPLAAEVVGFFRPALFALFGAAAFLLVITCTNADDADGCVRGAGARALRARHLQRPVVRRQPAAAGAERADGARRAAGRRALARGQAGPVARDDRWRRRSRRRARPGPCAVEPLVRRLVGRRDGVRRGSRGRDRHRARGLSAARAPRGRARSAQRIARGLAGSKPALP